MEDFNCKVSPQRRAAELDMKSRVKDAVLKSITKRHMDKDVDNLGDPEFETWVDEFIKWNITQRVEFGGEQVFHSMTYNKSIPDPKPGLDDPWSQWQERCDNLGLDAYLNSTEGKKQFRKKMVPKLKPLIPTPFLCRSLQSPERDMEKEEDQAFCTRLKEQVKQNPGRT